MSHGTRTDPQDAIGTGTVGGFAEDREPELRPEDEGLGPTQTKPAIFDGWTLAGRAPWCKRASLKQKAIPADRNGLRVSLGARDQRTMRITRRCESTITGAPSL
ncbi:hypothetical protein GCM10011390_13480 [Aureimonas endophytica]|uniref:Uncharacterized protein n=1 Tax=Aureimonas endophytica TaxID=2027858 RepID=A0A916ZGE1_9HYPH|nr:hypothetical protein GCM10011390_13480 [Aureimonas endophytica]